MTNEDYKESKRQSQEAMRLLEEQRRERHNQINIDLANQVLWVSWGNTLQDGGILPKNRYFKTEGGK